MLTSVKITKLKTTVCFLAFFCFSGQLFGQQLFDLENAHWDISKTTWDAEEFNVSSQKVFQTSSKIGKIDTTGYTYYKVNTNLPFKLKTVYEFQFLIRQDSLTGKIFVKSFVDETEEFLLYDFNLNVGDKVKSVMTNQLEGDLIVTKAENVGTVENPVRMIEARLNGNGVLFKFTEGIGSMNGFLVNLPMDVLNGSVLKCYYTNDELTFSQGDECPPTPELRTRSRRN